jgi:hypothetical protein
MPPRVRPKRGQDEAALALKAPPKKKRPSSKPRKALDPLQEPPRLAPRAGAPRAPPPAAPRAERAARAARPPRGRRAATEAPSKAATVEQPSSKSTWDGRRKFEAVDEVLEDLGKVVGDEIVVPTNTTTAILDVNWHKLMAAAGASDPGVQILPEAPVLKLSYDDMSDLVLDVQLRLADEHGGHASLATFGGKHVVATRYDVGQYVKQKRTIFEVVLNGDASARSGHAAREFGAVLKLMRGEGHSSAKTLLDWCEASATAKGRDQLKMSLQKGGAGMITGKHGDGDWGSSCRDVTSLLYDQNATKYLALFAGEVKVGTGKGETRYPRTFPVALLGTLAQRHGQTYTGTRMGMGNDPVLASASGEYGRRAFYAFHQVLPGIPLTPMWNIVVDYK